MNKEKFDELIKTINDNISMLNYFMMPDGKLRLVAETTDGEKRYVKVLDNIQTHDAVIEKKMETNTTETRVEKLKADNDLIKKYETYEHAIDSLQMILNNRNGYWIKSNSCLSDLGQNIVIECIKQAGWKVNPEFPKISRKYVRKLNKVLSKCPFSKEQAISFSGNSSSTTKPSEEEPKSFWEWIFG